MALSEMSWSDIGAILAPALTAVSGAYVYIQKQFGDERLCRTELERDLAEFKERVARENVTHTYLEKFEQRLLEAVNRLGDRFDRLKFKDRDE